MTILNMSMIFTAFYRISPQDLSACPARPHPAALLGRHGHLPRGGNRRHHRRLMLLPDLRHPLPQDTYLTVTAILTDFLPDLTVMVALPFFLALITPLELTEATLELELE